LTFGLNPDLSKEKKGAPLRSLFDINKNSEEEAAE
jgi:hypothetical protein